MCEREDLVFWTGAPDKEKWQNRRVGVGITDAPCSCFCVFCERMFPFSEDMNAQPCDLESLAESLTQIGAENFDEVVISGGLVGDPLLVDESFLLKIAGSISGSFPDKSIRLNTTANTRDYQESNELLLRLRETGITSIAISVNAVNEADYNTVCRPSEGASYGKMIAFIHACIDVLGKENTILSFVNYPGVPEAADWPQFNLEQVTDFASEFGLQNQVVLRDYIQHGNG